MYGDSDWSVSAMFYDYHLIAPFVLPILALAFFFNGIIAIRERWIHLPFTDRRSRVEGTPALVIGAASVLAGVSCIGLLAYMLGVLLPWSG